MDPLISEQEERCIQLFAKLFASGQGHWDARRAMNKMASEGLDLNDDEGTYVLLMTMMEQYGVIKDAIHISDGRYFSFTIAPKAVQLARQLEKKIKESQARRDIVAQTTETARKHPIIAWVIIVFFLLTLLVTFATQTITLLEKTGLINRAEPAKQK